MASNQRPTLYPISYIRSSKNTIDQKSIRRLVGLDNSDTSFPSSFDGIDNISDQYSKPLDQSAYDRPDGEPHKNGRTPGGGRCYTLAFIFLLQLSQGENPCRGNPEQRQHFRESV